jgi:hypothetical protein
MSNSSVTSNKQRQQLAHRDRLGRLPVDRLADRADRLREALDIVMAGHVARLEMHFGDADVIAGDEAVEDFGEETALLLAEPPDNAHVDRDDHALRIDEEIARMHVGMEETVAQRMAQEGLDQRVGKRVEIVAGGLQPLDIGHLDAVDPLHRDDVAAGALPVDLGTRKPGSSRVFGDLRKRCRFQAQVHLDLGRLLQSLRDLHRPQPAAGGHEALLQVGNEIHRLEIVGKALSHAGTHHLDGHFPAPLWRHHFRRMHLGDRGGGDRRAEAGVEFLDRSAERASNIGLGGGIRKNAIRSCNCARSSANSTPTTSGRVARNWPILT